jgi:hypothetical protein
MPKPRDRRPPRPPPEPPTSKESWGSPRRREYLYREIDKRLAALQAERDAQQQEAPGLATGGYVRSSDGDQD